MSNNSAVASPVTKSISSEVAWLVSIPTPAGSYSPVLILACSMEAAEFKALERMEDGIYMRG